MPSITPVFTLTRGVSPVLVTIPHAGTCLPDGLADRMTPKGRTLPDTDWYMNRVYAGAGALGAGVLHAHFSRYVIDLNRGADNAPLYADRPKTGLVPLETFAGAAIYKAGQHPDADEIAERTACFWSPYHAAIEEELARLRALHGWAMLWDAHSIRAEIPRLFDGRLPDFSFGTNDGLSCAPDLVASAMNAHRAQGTYSDVLNGRFKGGFTTRHYGRPGSGLHAIQLEKAQTTYLASEDAPWPIDETSLARLQGAVQAMLRAVSSWRPEMSS